MPKFKVILGQIVREQASVIVEAPSQKVVENNLHEIYEQYTGEWEPDCDWGTEEGTHTLSTFPVDPSKKPNIKLKGN